MKATALEFRFRMLINLAIVVLGFWAPWIASWSAGQRIAMVEWLPLQLSRHSLLTFSVASPVVIILAALIAFIGAVLRVWGTAWLGPATVQHGEMQAGAVMADGPYRYVRNPLYLGLWCMFAALSFLMLPTGALVTMILITVFLLRLIFGEETFLAVQLGKHYQNYLSAVPRVIPRLHSTLPPTGRNPHWLHAVLSELTPIGVFFTLAFLSWTYDNRLIMRSILITFGVSLVVRALLPAVSKETNLPQ